VKPGFHAANVLVLDVDLPSSLSHTDSDRTRVYDSLLSSLSQLPGVLRVSAASAVPLSGHTNGQAVAPGDQKLTINSLNAERNVVAVGYFDILHIPLLSGRLFSQTDAVGSPEVALVSESFARRLWPGEAALGKQFRCPHGIETIVGIVGDVKDKSLDRDPDTMFYLSAAQAPTNLSLLVETQADPHSLAKEAQQRVWSTAPGSAIAAITSTDAYLDRALAPSRYRTLLGAGFAGFALLLTAVGVAGLTGRNVTHRRKELCIRMALGATLDQAIGHALKRGMTAVATGALCGLLLAPLTSRTVAEYLYQIKPGDPQTYIATTLVIAVVAAVAGLVGTRSLRRAPLANVLRND